MSGLHHVVLWDIDGTLVDITRDSDDKHRAAVEAHLGRSIKAEKSWSGRTDGDILTSLAKSADVALDAAQLSSASRLLEEATQDFLGRQPAVALPGVTECLALATEFGFVNGLLTGNTRPRAQVKLESAGLWQWFQRGPIFSGEGPAPRVALACDAAETLRNEAGCRRVVVVGDTPADIQAAKAAKFESVAVATGTYDLPELAYEAPDLVLVNLADGMGDFSTFLDPSG